MNRIAIGKTTVVQQEKLQMLRKLAIQPDGELGTSPIYQLNAANKNPSFDSQPQRFEFSGRLQAYRMTVKSLNASVLDANFLLISTCEPGSYFWTTQLMLWAFLLWLHLASNNDGSEITDYPSIAPLVLYIPSHIRPIQI